MVDVHRITERLRGVSFTPSEAREIIDMVQARVQAPPVVDLDFEHDTSTDDLLDVLAWTEGAELGWGEWAFHKRNEYQLAAWDEAGTDDEGMQAWEAMDFALQWALNEVIYRGTASLRAVLDLAGIKCRSLTDL